jgi:mycothiol synthase
VRIASPLQIGPLDAAAQDAVRALAAAAEEADGVAPLSEQPLLHLDADEDWLTHAVAHDKHGATIGYLQVDRGGDVASAELVVHPRHRRNGTGSMLLRTAERDARLPSRSGAPDQRGTQLRVWAHGDLPAARAFATARGYAVVRELLLLARQLDDVPPTPGLPAGYTVRTFRPGHDDEAWVALNARAFASHPEQGRLTVEDLRRRRSEPWFDPAGFFLLTDAHGRLAGYHWTKIEHGRPEDDTVDGEVYALGIDPDHQGRGLAAPLTAVGLRHLAATGCTRVVLYVDGDNTPALRTYERAGFARAAVDVQYARA